MMNNFLLNKNDNKRRLRSEYIKGFHTGRDLQWTLGPSASIPYSLAQVRDEGWLVGDESGNVWCLADGQQDTPNSFENILEFESGVSEISPLNRFKVLIGEMRGNVTQLDLSHLTAETINQIKCVKHRAPVKCIRWQPNQSEIFATASQDGSIIFADLRSPNSPFGCLNGSHQLGGSVGKSSRSTMTGFVFHPLNPELFYTSGTPDTSVRLWDMRKLSNYTSFASANLSTYKRTSKRSLSNKLTPTEEFSTSTYNLRKHRSSTALTIDSIGSRLFLATSNDNVFEFITANPDVGPVASYTAPGFNSCSFFSNLSIDPTDRFLLSGSSNGQAYIWDTLTEKLTEDSGGVFELPVCAQLEVSKTAWVNGKRGSLEAQIACISDDLTFSIFNWNIVDIEEISRNNLNSLKKPRELFTEGREKINLCDLSVIEETNKETTRTQSPLIPTINTQTQTQPQAQTQTFSIPPVTPIRKKSSNNFNLIGTPPSSANKSILDFFTRSPRV